MRAPGLDILLEEYLSQFEVQAGAGLLVVECEDDLWAISEELNRNDIVESRTWWSALQRLASHEMTFVVLDMHLSDEMLEIIKQVVQHKDHVTVRDSQTSELQQAQVSTTQPLLLVVATQACVSSTKSLLRLSEGIPFVRFVA